ncbi:peroxiredoxin family protein [Larkinella rosea]|uniref:TlpA family protein disulfide reductase n=1 Tax=Larkinella rosea TaxID=2025312 RepID=A0A3P1BD11_9BACT|nr:TlpA disulfide reductase family protein [Larkinella rosea]RRA98949.1 TlpA family protein disulfide reductase [Larkinella rosea]
MKKNVALLLAILFWAPFAGVAQSGSTLKTGVWRAVLKNKGGELPFGLEVTQTGSTYTAFALNGAERLRFDSVTLKGDSVRFAIDIFEAEIRAKVDGNTLRGFWRRRRTGTNYTSLPFEAQHGVTYRFTGSTETPKINVTGTWATTFRSETDSTVSVGIFEQKGNKLTGTFLTTTGDYRYLEGNVVGDSLLLSTFDGTHLYLFKARRKPDNTLVGGYWSGESGYESWTARFDPKAKLPDATSLTYLKPGYKTIAFTFPDLKGKPVSLTDARFKNKVVVVQILGSWCPNCMDETNFLSPWYKKNKNRGVEIVGLAYEKSAELAESAPKIQRMIDRFKIDYPVVLAGTNVKSEASKTLPMLNQVVGFPTMIVIDKKGTVRQIHTGFTGPGTGNYYDAFVEEYNRLIDKLVKE